MPRLRTTEVREILERAHASFCETVAALGDDAAPVVVVIYPELVVAMIVPGGAEEILATLDALADPSSPIAAREVVGLIAHATAWGIDAETWAVPYADEADARALGELHSLAVSWWCHVGRDGFPILEGLATLYDPATLELGATASATEGSGILGLALARATVICHQA